MTEREKIERELILDILIESSKWRISEDDDQNDGIRLEVMDRARRLFLGTETVDANWYAQGHPDNLPAEDEVLNEDDYKELEAARLNEYLANRSKSKRKWAKNRVRVIIDGKPTWKLRSQCHKEVMPGWTTKLHWVWDGPAGDEETAVDKLGDELWNEHEKGE